MIHIHQSVISVILTQNLLKKLWKVSAKYIAINLLDKVTYYKNPSNASCVDLIINKPRSFQNPYTFKTRLSDFHEMTLTTKIILCKTETRVLNYYNSKFINNTLFRDQVRNKLRSSNLQISDRDLRHFKEICLPVLNTIVLRANQTSFINKESRRAVMVVRSKLRKKLLKSRSVSDKKAYNKQKNKWISLLRKTEKA